MSDELEAIYDQTTSFVANEVVPKAEQWERDGVVPREVLRHMGSLGMFSLRVPTDHGGLGVHHLEGAPVALHLAGDADLDGAVAHRCLPAFVT